MCEYMNHRKKSSGSLTQQRAKRGSAISDFGPALFVLFIVILFPLLDIIGLTFSYGLCWYLNFKISNQVARCKKIDEPKIAQLEIDKVSATGFAAFLKVQKIDVPTPAYNDSENPPTVSVTTSVTSMPFLTIPFFFKAPGLNDPITFSISTTLTRELTL